MRQAIARLLVFTATFSGWVAVGVAQEPASPEQADRLYRRLASTMEGLGVRVATGRFGAEMMVELVNDGLNLGAGNSVGRLKFEQHGCAGADHGLHAFCIVHERCLARMQDHPGCKKPADDHAESEVIIPFWFVGKQDEPRCNNKAQGNKNKGVLT